MHNDYCCSLFYKSTEFILFLEVLPLTTKRHFLQYEFCVKFGTEFSMKILYIYCMNPLSTLLRFIIFDVSPTQIVKVANEKWQKATLLYLYHVLNSYFLRRHLQPFGMSDVVSYRTIYMSHTSSIGQLAVLQMFTQQTISLRNSTASLL